MKIGILTLPLHSNYGGILQAYALQTVLEKMGHEVDHIQKKPDKGHSFMTMPLVYTKRLLVKIFKNNKVKIFTNPHKKELLIHTHLITFIRRYINVKYIKTLNSLNPEDYDGIVVGSDQIWRRDYYDKKYRNIMLSSNPEDGFLSFAKEWKIKRVAYAASLGFDRWDYTQKETNNIHNLLNQFTGISLREKSGVDLFRINLGMNPMHVLDPTFLLTQDDYNKIIEEEKSKPFKGDVLCYILDDNEKKRNIISDIIKKHSLSPYYINPKVDLNIPVEENILPSVGTWLKGFRDAKYIITDSFHACVFSIIYNKPFIAIGNNGRGLTRFESLLSTFKLNHLLVSENSKDIDLLKDFDWNQVNSVLEIEKKKSIDFLKSSLK